MKFLVSTIVCSWTEKPLNIQFFYERTKERLCYFFPRQQTFNNFEIVDYFLSLNLMLVDDNVHYASNDLFQFFKLVHL